MPYYVLSTPTNMQSSSTSTNKVYESTSLNSMIIPGTSLATRQSISTEVGLRNMALNEYNLTNRGYAVAPKSIFGTGSNLLKIRAASQLYIASFYFNPTLFLT